MNTTSIIPAWLEEHCGRLRQKDESLTNLNLNIRRLDKAMMESLAAAVCQSPHLTVLNLTSSLVVNNNNNRDDDVVRTEDETLSALMRVVLPHQKSALQVLHLSYNQLNNVANIGQELQTNQNLVELHLSYNRINAKSAKALAQGLIHNHKLIILTLSCNQVGDEGAQHIASALKINKSLRILGLERNGIRTKGAEALQEALSCTYSLHECRVAKNEMTMAQESIITTTCRANKAGRGLLLVGSSTYSRNSHENNQKRSSSSSTAAASSSASLLPFVLSRAKDDPNVVFFLLESSLDKIDGDRQRDGSNYNKKAKIVKEAS